MKAHALSIITAALILSVPAIAKDDPIGIKDCPAPVQALVRHYSQGGTLEEIAIDHKKKSGGPAVYEAKFLTAAGKRIEIHMSPAGKVLKVENKN